MLAAFGDHGNTGWFHADEIAETETVQREIREDFASRSALLLTG